MAPRKAVDKGPKQRSAPASKGRPWRGDNVVPADIKPAALGTECPSAVRQFLRNAIYPKGRLYLARLSSNDVAADWQLAATKPMHMSSWYNEEEDEVDRHETEAARVAIRWLDQCLSHLNNEFLESACSGLAGCSSTWSTDKKLTLTFRAFNSDSHIASELKKVDQDFADLLRPHTVNAKGIMVVLGSDLPSSGVTDNIVLVKRYSEEVGRRGRKDDRQQSDEELVAHAAQQMPLSGRMAEKLKELDKDTLSDSASVTYDCTFTVVILSAPFPVEWLALEAGGHGFKKEEMKENPHVLTLCMAVAQYVRPFIAAFEATRTVQKHVNDFLSGDTEANSEHARLPRSLILGLALQRRWIVAPEIWKSSTASFRRDQLERRLGESEEVLGHTVNADQREAVLKLREGTFLLHGPPGTGKSTTIFHLLTVRVQRDSPVLITTQRNAALRALLAKLSRPEDLQKQIVVFGSPARIGADCIPFHIERLMQCYEGAFSPVDEELHQSLKRTYGAFARATPWVDIVSQLREGAKRSTDEIEEALEHIKQPGFEHDLDSYKRLKKTSAFLRDFITTCDTLHTKYLDKVLVKETAARFTSTRLQEHPWGNVSAPSADPESVSLVDSAVARAEQAHAVAALLPLLKNLRTLQLLLYRRLRLCTVDTVPTLNRLYQRIVADVLGELVDEGVARSLPNFARAPLSLSEAHASEWKALVDVPDFSRRLLRWAVRKRILALNAPDKFMELVPFLLQEYVKYNTEGLSLSDFDDMEETFAQDPHALQDALEWLSAVQNLGTRRSMHRWMDLDLRDLGAFGAFNVSPMILLPRLLIDEPTRRAYCGAKCSRRSDDTEDCAFVFLPAEKLAAAVPQPKRRRANRKRAQQEHDDAPVEPHAQAVVDQASVHRLAEEVLKNAGVLFQIAESSTKLATACYLMARAGRTPGHLLAAVRHLVPQLKEVQESNAFAGYYYSRRNPDSKCRNRNLPLPVDTVILDEAGCVADYTTPLLLALQPANLVLVGDPKQLEVVSEFHNLKEPKSAMPADLDKGTLAAHMAWHSRSTMGRLDACELSAPCLRRNGSQVSRLCTQYRMHPDMCRIVSDTFYTEGNAAVGELVTDDALKLQRIQVVSGLARLDAECAWREGAMQHIVVHEGDSLEGVTTAHRAGYSNKAEAFVALLKAKEAFWALHKYAVQEGWTAEDRARHFNGAPETLDTEQAMPFWPRVFLLTQYTQQRNLLQALLNSDPEITPNIAPSFEAITVDQSQGDEADVIILSVVVAYDTDDRDENGAAQMVLSPFSVRGIDAVQKTDFVQHRNRANVAISRMRYLAVMVSSQSVTRLMGFNAKSLWGRILSSKDVRRRYALPRSDGNVNRRALFKLVAQLPHSVLADAKAPVAPRNSGLPGASHTAGHGAQIPGSNGAAAYMAPRNTRCVAIVDQLNFAHNTCSLFYAACVVLLWKLDMMNELGKEPEAREYLGGAGYGGSEAEKARMWTTRSRESVIELLECTLVSRTNCDKATRHGICVDLLDMPLFEGEHADMAAYWDATQKDTYLLEVMHCLVMMVIDHYASYDEEGMPATTLAASEVVAAPVPMNPWFPISSLSNAPAMTHTFAAPAQTPQQTLGSQTQGNPFQINAEQQGYASHTASTFTGFNAGEAVCGVKRHSILSKYIQAQWDGAPPAVALYRVLCKSSSCDGCQCGRPRQRPLQSPKLREQLKWLFQRRYDQYEHLVTQEEMKRMVPKALAITASTLNIPPPQRAWPCASASEAVTRPVTCRWGAVPRLIASRYSRDGIAYQFSLQPTQPLGRRAAQASSYAPAYPMPAPHVLFALDWFAKDVRWRELTEQKLMPLVEALMHDAGNRVTDKHDEAAERGDMESAKAVLDNERWSLRQELTSLVPRLLSQRGELALRRRMDDMKKVLRIVRGWLPREADVKTSLLDEIVRSIKYPDDCAEAALFQTLQVEGCEADDIAASIAWHFVDQRSRHGAGADVHVVLVTSDRDWLQYLEHPHVHCCDLMGVTLRPEMLMFQGESAAAWRSNTHRFDCLLNSGTLHERAVHARELEEMLGVVRKELRTDLDLNDTEVQSALARVAVNLETWRKVLGGKTGQLQSIDLELPFCGENKKPQAARVLQRPSKSAKPAVPPRSNRPGQPGPNSARVAQARGGPVPAKKGGASMYGKKPARGQAALHSAAQASSGAAAVKRLCKRHGVHDSGALDAALRPGCASYRADVAAAFVALSRFDQAALRSELAAHSSLGLASNGSSSPAGEGSASLESSQHGGAAPASGNNGSDGASAKAASSPVERVTAALAALDITSSNTAALKKLGMEGLKDMCRSSGIWYAAAFEAALKKGSLGHVPAVATAFEGLDKIEKKLVRKQVPSEPQTASAKPKSFTLDAFDRLDTEPSITASLKARSSTWDTSPQSDVVASGPEDADIDEDLGILDNVPPQVTPLPLRPPRPGLTYAQPSQRSHTGFTCDRLPDIVKEFIAAGDWSGSRAHGLAGCGELSPLYLHVVKQLRRAIVSVRYASEDERVRRKHVRRCVQFLAHFATSHCREVMPESVRSVLQTELFYRSWNSVEKL